ncbi:Glutamate-gated chloride channel subunit beta, partial [Trichinella pseudospiralis]
LYLFKFLCFLQNDLHLSNVLSNGKQFRVVHKLSRQIQFWKSMKSTIIGQQFERGFTNKDNKLLQTATDKRCNSCTQLAPHFGYFGPDVPISYRWLELQQPMRIKRSDNKTNYRSWREQRLVKNLLLNYSSNLRPASAHEPVLVMTSIHITGLSAIDEFNMEYKVQFKFQQEWIDKRLTFKDPYFSKDEFIYLSKDQNVWIPDTFFQNEKRGTYHALDQPNFYVKIRADGTVVYNRRLTMTFACAMQLEKYPMDEQTCNMDFSSYAYTDADVDYAWSLNPLKISPWAESELSNFVITSFKNASCTSKTATGTYTCLRVELHLRRLFSFFLLQLYIPSSLLVAVSWVSYWIDWRAAAGRVPLSIITLLTMITHSYAINAKLPPVSYAKALDVWIGACIMFIFGSLIEYAFVNYAGLREQFRIAEIKGNESQIESANFSTDQYDRPIYANQDELYESYPRRRKRSSISKQSEEIRLSPSMDFKEEKGTSVLELVDMTNNERQKRRRLKLNLSSLNFFLRISSRADQIDIISRYLFPLLFCSFNAVYWSIYW